VNAFVLHDSNDQAAVRRWSVSAVAIVTAHAALIAVAMNWYTQRPTPGVSLPATMVDMAPVTSAPQSKPQDTAPGPEMQEADASPPEPIQQQLLEQQIAPTPPQEKPEVVAPPEQKVQPTPPKPEPAQTVPEHKPAPAKRKVVRPEAKKPSDAPAPRTTAPSRAERQAPAASAISAGASASAIASYNQRVRAHLMRLHRYPSGGNGQRGIVRLSFTLSRSGQVLSSRVGGSSGIPAFDAQAMALLRQAQPFPAFPSEISYASMPFSVPVEFKER
jgi:protein TonB